MVSFLSFKEIFHYCIFVRRQLLFEVLGHSVVVDFEPSLALCAQCSADVSEHVSDQHPDCRQQSAVICSALPLISCNYVLNQSKCRAIRILMYVHGATVPDEASPEFSTGDQLLLSSSS